MLISLSIAQVLLPLPLVPRLRYVPSGRCPGPTEKPLPRCLGREPVSVADRDVSFAEAIGPEALDKELEEQRKEGPLLNLCTSCLLLYD